MLVQHVNESAREREDRERDTEKERGRERGIKTADQCEEKEAVMLLPEETAAFSRELSLAGLVWLLCCFTRLWII